MNVFVLCTGRCGSTTFIESAKHIVNFTAGHETRCHWTGAKRFAYPQHHIEADNRLSWLLGRLDETYGDNAFYVHLIRDRDATARSYARRYPKGILGAYHSEILMDAASKNREATVVQVAADYCDTVNANIRLFLRDKSHRMEMATENAKERLAEFWERCGAEGDFSRALAAWDVRHNASPAAPPDTGAPTGKTPA